MNGLVLKKRTAILILASIAVILVLLLGNQLLSGYRIPVIWQDQSLSLNAGELTELIHREQMGRELLIYTSDGDVIRLENVEKAGTSLSGKFYIDAGGKRYKQVAGILLEPPEQAITDLYGKIMDQVKRNRRVLLIYIDGLGYGNLDRLLQKGLFPNIEALGAAQKAATVFPPITDVAFTSMVTGKTPKYTGIRKRGDGGLQVKTLFEALSAEGKKTVAIEADIKILKDESETILNIDQDKDGAIDDETFAAAMKRLKQGDRFVLVHFHSFDDRGHRFGPYSKEAEEQLKTLDSYVGQLASVWQDIIILTADHGMHGEKGQGVHGAFNPEDIYIPVIYSRFD